MSIYFIDYENVGASGLQGINRLSEGDLVVVFHGMNSGSISFDLHVQIFSSRATIEYIRTAKSAKNYLDFQLTTYLGYQVANSNASEFIIVSRDAGFDSVIDFWRNRAGRRTFKRQWSIGSAISNTANVIKPGNPLPAAEEVVKEIASEEPVDATPAEAVIEAKIDVLPENATEVEHIEEVAEPVKKTTRTRKKSEPKVEISDKPTTTRTRKKVEPESEVTVQSEPLTKLPTEYKKLLVENLKSYKLNVRSYSTIHSLILKNSDEDDFKNALAKAFPGRDEDIFGLIGETYRLFNADRV